MEIIMKSPGFQHIADDIFSLLEKKSLLECRMVDKSWKKIMDQPGFWLKKQHRHDLLDIQINSDGFRQAGHKDYKCISCAKSFSSKGFLKSHIALIHKTNKEYNLRHINSLKSWKSLSQKLGDGLGSSGSDPAEIDADTISSQVQKNFVLILMKNLGKFFWSPLEIVVKLKEAGEKFPHLIEFIIEHEDPTNRVDIEGYEKWNRYRGLTSIHLAAFYNLPEVVKKITTKNYDHDGFPILKTTQDHTPIHFAAMAGNLNMVKHLATYTDNPNSRNIYGWTPLYYAAHYGHLDIIKFLVNFTDSPNAPNINHYTPIWSAAFNGHLEVVKFLMAFTENPDENEYDFVDRKIPRDSIKPNILSQIQRRKSQSRIMQKK